MREIYERECDFTIAKKQKDYDLSIAEIEASRAIGIAEKNKPFITLTRLIGANQAYFHFFIH